MANKDYRAIRREQKEAAVWEAIVAILATMRPEDLSIAGISGDLANDAAEATLDDDVYGKAAVAFLTFIGNCSLTYQDRVVVAQALICGANAIIKNNAVNKYLFDGENILSALPIFSRISAMKTTDPPTPPIMGDAFLENMDESMKYVSQYNRDVIDYTKRWTMSGKMGDIEGQTDKPWWKDMMNFLAIPWD